MTRNRSRRSFLRTVVAAGIVGTAGCLSPGHEAWQREHPTEVTELVGAGDTVYVGTRDKRVHAVDAASGETRWTFVTGGPIEHPPVPVADGVVVPSSDGTIYGVSDGGEERWRHGFAQGIEDLSVVDRTVYAFGIQYDAGASDLYRGDLLAIDATTGDRLWRRRTTESLTYGPLAVAGGTVTVLDPEDKLYGFDRASGDRLWETFSANGLRAVGDTLVVDSDVGLTAYGPGGDERWERGFPTDGFRVGAFHAPSDTAIFEQDSAVSAVDLTTGETRWRVDYVTGSVAVVDDTAVVARSTDCCGASGPTLIGKRFASGNVEWRAGAEYEACNGVAADGDGVIAALSDPEGTTFVRFDADGNPNWRAGTDLTHWTVAGGRVVGIDHGTGLTCLEPGYL